MKTFEEIQEALSDIENLILTGSAYVSAAQVGLDPRAGRVFVGKDFIASNSARNLDYYGGFEYVDEEHVVSVGMLKVYSAESERIARCLELFNDKEEDFE